MEFYTDGGCRVNPGGLGSWAFVVVENGQEIHSAAGHEDFTTNNRAELMAVIESMRYAHSNGLNTPTIYTDSDLTVKCGMGLWKRKANMDLWRQFEGLKAILHGVRLVWVRGHGTNQWNNRADQLCNDAMDARQDQLEAPEDRFLRSL